MDSGTRIEAKLKSTHYRRSPLVQGDLEITFAVKVMTMPTEMSKMLVDGYKELVESIYFEPPDSEIIKSFLQSDEQEAPGAASGKSTSENVCRKNQRSKNVVIVTFEQSLLLPELKISKANLSICPL